MLRIVLGLLFVPLFAFAIDPKSAPVPVAKQVPQVIEQHGEKRSDPFFWIKSKTDADVLKYLKTENDYTLAVMKPTDALQKKLYDEYLSRIQQTDRDVPWRDRGYWYYTRTEEGKQYPIVCRKKGNLEAVEEIMLDGNVLGKDEKFFAVGEWRVSDDGHLLAYSTDTTGFREYELSVKDLRTGKLVESKLVKAPGFEWAANGTLFYVTEDDAKRASKVWRHTLGQPRDKDVMVFEEKDEEFWIEMARSRDGQYLFHSSVSFGSTEQWYLPANKPTDPWKVILPRQADIEYQAGHRDGQFYIVTNKGATNFKVVTCPVGQTENPAAFVDLMPYDRQVFIEGIALFQNFAVLTVRTNGLPGLIVRDLKSGATHPISFDEPTWDVSLGQNPEFDVSSIRFTYSSMLTPESEFEYDLTTKSRKLLKKKEVPNYDPANYQIERISATASDGTKVPISLIYPPISCIWNRGISKSSPVKIRDPRNRFVRRRTRNGLNQVCVQRWRQSK